MVSGMSDSEKSAFTIDLSGVETPAGKVGRVLIGALLLVVFGALALACGVLYFFGAFIPGVSDAWAGWLVDLAPFAGAIFVGLAIVGFVVMRKGRNSEQTVDTIVNVLEATGLADVETDEGPSSTLPGKPLPPTVV